MALQRADFEKLVKALEKQSSAIDALRKDFEYLKKDLVNTEKSLSVMEREIKTQNEAMSLELNKFRDAESSKRQVTEGKIAAFITETEMSMQSLKAEMSSLKTQSKPTNSPKMIDLEAIIKKQTAEVTQSVKSLNVELKSLKAENVKLQADIVELKSNQKSFAERLEGEPDHSCVVDNNSLENPRDAIIKKIYQYFPKGKCYFYDDFSNSGVQGFKKYLIDPKFENNYIKRIPNWQSQELGKPYETRIGKKHFLSPNIIKCHGTVNWVTGFILYRNYLKIIT